jgi:predicted nucleic acid-binding Zn ribbon protein
MPTTNPPRKCQHCDRPIPPGKRPQAVYCSVECRTAAQVERQRQQIQAQQRDRGRREDGQYLCVCEYEPCNKTFWSSRPHAQYCSDVCKQAFYRHCKRLGC